MKRFVLSTLSILVAASASAPMAQAFDTKVDPSFSLQELRLSELDARDKSAASEKTFNVHKLRTAQFDQRNKVGDKLSTTSLMEQRRQVLERSSYSK
ncbi:MAG: hypothetical protein WBD47_17450 [Phormidesmis sp.]